MSMFGEMNFFLGLQTIQSDKGIFISQSKYVRELLKKFGMEDSKPVGTPMVTRCKLSKDDDSPKANQKRYRSMIGGLLYLTEWFADLRRNSFHQTWTSKIHSASNRQMFCTYSHFHQK